MHLVRRITVLLALSVLGVALLAPLAARSAAPVSAPLPQPLLADAARLSVADLGRGGTSARDAALAPLSGAEAVAGAVLPTPGTAPMEATLLAAATPVPTPRPAPAAPAPRPATYRGSSVWDDLAECESGGNWAINTGNGYYGGLQFSYDTWHGYGGGEFAEYPHLATREQQIAVAERLHAARGFAPWPACRAKLGLP